MTIEVETKTMTLLPPAPGQCQTCAHGHAPDQPHNRYSLYYQMAFHQEHGRWPGWADAMAHCSAEVQAAWTEALLEAGQSLGAAEDPPHRH